MATFRESDGFKCEFYLVAHRQECGKPATRTGYQDRLLCRHHYQVSKRGTKPVLTPPNRTVTAEEKWELHRTLREKLWGGLQPRLLPCEKVQGGGNA